MGVDGKLENPLLKHNTGLSSKLLKSSEASKGGLLSFQSCLSKQTVPSSSKDLNFSSQAKYASPSLTTSFQHASLLHPPSNQSIKSHQSSLKTPLVSNLSPSLFNNQLGGRDGLLKKSGFVVKTSLSLKGDNKNVQQTQGHMTGVNTNSLKATLHNPKLSQFDKLNTEVSQLGKLSSNISSVSSSGRLIQTKPPSGLGNVKVKKSKGKGRFGGDESADKFVSSKGPTYDISLADTLNNEKNVDHEKFLKVKVDHFVEKKDASIMMKKEKERVDGKKVDLINLVSIALLRSPDLEDGNDETRKQLMKQVKEMAKIDPEFILKLALYTRKRLNIRIVTNFLLAYCAFLQETRPFLKKYYSKSIMLPTDWVTVAELYQTFFDKSINTRSLPTALRNVMVAKFPEFDEYQLGKYNNEKPKPKKVIYRVADSSEEEEEDSFEEIESREFETYTLKKLVRKLHISEPVYNVMCIIGKRYPDNSQKFYQARLPGIFDETKSSQRMKLATPETWETQVSLKGNKDTTWQDLLDNKKLPFMAMLRNLRNMLISGITPKHHNKVLRRLTDEKQVINSRQFPFRFLSAYEVLEELEEMLANSAYLGITIPTQKRSGKPIVVARNAFSKSLLKRYKLALDTALKISTIYNIPPICGTTVIVIHYDPDFDDTACASTKSISKQRTVIEMCLLLGLMCKFHCEDGILLLLDTKTDRYMEVEDLNTDMILNNMKVMQEKMKDISNGERDIMKYLNGFLTERKKIDNFLMVSGLQDPTFTDKFLEAYRKDVNPTCLCVTVLLLGNKSETKLNGKYDVRVCGFSDQVLLYVAERGNGKQLTCIEKIDVAYGLEEIMVRSKARAHFVPSTEIIERPVMPWKTVRVFISSTFKDMHGERDLLTRYVFPELRCRCYNYCLNVYEVDLRWGITDKQSQSLQQIEICLREVTKADLFIGILGERYGWVPDNYDALYSTPLAWLKSCTPSITELEMRCFLQKEGKMFKSKSMFYFRDKSFIRQVPKDYVKDFTCESRGKGEKLENLKAWVHHNNAEIYENYPCQWGGVIGNKPIVSGLEEFGQRVLNNLWNAIKVNYLSYKSRTPVNDNTDLSIDKHYEFATEMSKSFVGRKKLVDKALAELAEVKNKSGKHLLLISGKSGSGKTAFMSKVITMYCEEMKANSCCYFVDAAEGKKSLVGLVKYVLETVNRSFNGGCTIPETYSELKLKVEELFKFISKNLCGEQCVIFIDSLDKVDAGVQSSLTDWIPEFMPKGVYLVISCTENTACQKILSSHKQIIDVIKVGAMELADRANFVRQILSNYGKELDESPFNNQMKLLLSKKDSSSPLYLKLACDELRMFGVYEKFYHHIQKLAQTVPHLIEFCLQRMEMENGEHLIRDALVLFYFSRQGLNEDELFDTLNMLQNFNNVTIETIAEVGFKCFHKSNFIQQQIPQSYFMKMCRSIKLFLNEEKDSGIMKLIYNDILKVVEKRYINPGGYNYMSKVHIVLAGFYKKQADPGNNLKWSGNDRKALIELPYHLTASAISWKDLQALLCSIDFIRAKVEGNMCTQLLEDFQADVYAHSRQIQMERKKVLNHPDVVKTKEFISENIHILSKYPMLLMQQAVNAPDGSYIHKCTEAFTEVEMRNVIAWLNKPAKLSTCSLTITQRQPLLCVCLSKDETMIACGMEDGQLILYDKNTTKELKSFVGHASSITSCCFVGMDKLCSASDDGSISVWDVHGGHRLHVLDKHSRQVSCCTATEDGKLLLSASWDNTAKLWNIHDGSVAGELSGFIHPFNCIALDRYQKHAALGGWNRNIVIWNILENVKTAVYKGHSSSVRALTYAPSGRHLASASLAGEILLWSTENGAMVGQLSYRSFPMTSLCYTPSGLELVSASTNASIKVWSGSLGMPELTYAPEDIKEITDYALCVAVRKDVIAVGYNSGKVVLFDQKKNILNQWKGHTSSVRSLSFIHKDTSTPNKASTKHLITASDDCLVKRWSIGSKVKCLSTMKGHARPVRCVRSKEAYIISGSEDCTLHVWQGLIFDKDAEDDIKPAAVLRGHTNTVTCCDISPCETMAMSGSIDKSFVLWDLNKKIAVCTVIHAHADGLTACSWSDVGNFVITGSNDFMMKLWDAMFLIANKDDADKLKEKVKFVGHSGTINDIKYKYGCVTSVCTDGSVKVWTHKGIEITTFSPHEKRINCCDIWTPSLECQLFGTSEKNWSDVVKEKSIQQKVKASKRASMNDVLVYTASDDGTVSSYKPFKPFLLNELYGHTDVVSDALVSSKQSEVISCSFDKTIKTWDHRLTSEVGNVTVHSGEVSCIAFTSGGALAASGGYDGYIRIYSLDTFTCLSSFICSTDAVKSVEFCSYEHIVTGDNLGNVCVWNIEEEKVIASVLMDSPVQCVAIGGDSGNYVVVSSYTQFQVFIWNGSSLTKIVESLNPTSEQLNTFHLSEKPRYVFEYPMSSMVFLNESSQLLSIEDNSNFHFCDVRKHPNKGARIIPKKEYNSGLKPKRTEMDSAASCIAYDMDGSKLYVYIGNTNGTISFNEMNLRGDLAENFSSRKFHDNYVTGILINYEQNLIVTASKDCTVKVWKYSNRKNPLESMQQIGLFHCRAPVTQLKGIISPKSIILMVGDANGNVDFLRVNV